MQKLFKRTIAIVLSAVMLFSVFSVISFAESEEHGTYYDDLPVSEKTAGAYPVLSSIEKKGYEVLNTVVNEILYAFCWACKNPSGWKDVSEIDETYYLSGRDTYATEAAQNNYWSAGYGSRSIVPDDFDASKLQFKYYIGRNPFLCLAKGINDDCRVRAIALDDNSDEGIVTFAAVDGLGVTDTDVLTIRENVLNDEYITQNNINVAAINVSATHSHTSIDVQGFATRAIYRILTGLLVRNHFDAFFEFLPAPLALIFAPAKRIITYIDDYILKCYVEMKDNYIQATTQAILDAVKDMKPGTLSWANIDFEGYNYDDRGLIPDENLPDTAAFHFVPNDGSEGIYFADIPCHPTTFDDDIRYFSADYITYLEQRIEEVSGDRFLMVQGPSGVVYAKKEVDDYGLTEEEKPSVQSRYTGKIFADLILAGEYEELAPVINAKYTHFFFKPTNAFLNLAIRTGLVNNMIYTNGNSVLDINVVIEEGYVELGGRVGLCLFPVELYPEVFCGTDIIPDYTSISWDGNDWNYPAPEDLAPRDGISMYAVHLCNNALGYCLPDNDFAFLGHMLGKKARVNDNELLSLGKPTASAVVTRFKDLMDSIKNDLAE